MYLLLISLLAVSTAGDSKCGCEYNTRTVTCSRLHLTDFDENYYSCGSVFWKIDLSENALSVYPDDLIQFSSVNLSGNSLEHLDAVKTQKVEHLDVSANILTEIDLENTFLSLRYLNAFNNNLGMWEEEFLNGHCNIVHLDVSQNKIQSLQPVTKCVKLSVLLAAENLISNVPDNLSVLKTLKLLDLSRNKLKHVFGFPKVLETLDLSFNELKKVSILTFKSLTLLTVVNLSGNKINDVDRGAFNDLISLKTLQFERNKLKMVTNESFSGMKSLKELDLSYNNFVSILENTFSDLPALETLRLDGNLLTTLPRLRFGRNVKLVSLMLNFIKKMNFSTVLTMLSGSAVMRAVIFPLNFIRGDDPEWPMIVRRFDWDCLSDWIPQLRKLLSHEAVPSRHRIHKMAPVNCPCVRFMKNERIFGTCVSDVGEIDGRSWIEAAEMSKVLDVDNEDENYLQYDRDEL